MSFTVESGQINGIIERIADTMTQKVSVSIQDYNHPITYYDLSVNQQLSEHHTFSFVWKLGDSPLQNFKSQANVIKKYLGNEVSINMKGGTGRNSIFFKGIITQMEVRDDDGASKGFRITGNSPTVMLDDAKQSRTFIKKTLKDIISEVASDGPGETEVNPSNTDNLPYITQYNETDWEFLQRMAICYGEWMYYDGQTIQFGKSVNTDTKLMSGVNLHDFTICSSVLPAKVNFNAYDYSSADSMVKDKLDLSFSSQNFFAQHTSSISGMKVHRRVNKNKSFVTGASSKQDLERIRELYQKGQEARSINYKGTSKVPLQIGGIVSISKEATESRFIITEAVHTSDDYGHYECRFESVPYDVSVPGYTNPFIFRKGQSQAAKVVDNNDPRGLGRVIVEFHWACKSNWIRMVQPHGGSGKGFYFVPEIGEEVLVDFEGGNTEKPYIAGTMYNGKEVSGYAGGNNDLKAIHTRSGHVIKLDDTDGTEKITITDKNKNIIELDTASKNIKISAPETINISAKNINIDAEESINIGAGKNIGSSAGETYTIMARDIFEHADEYMEINSKTSEATAESVQINSTEEDLLLNSSKRVINNSGEKVNLF